MEHRAGSMRPNVPSGEIFFESACQIRACPVMTGLLAGPLTDAAGPDAVRADLASVVQQVLEPTAAIGPSRPRDKPSRSPEGDHPGGSASGPTITVASGDPHRRA